MNLLPYIPESLKRILRWTIAPIASVASFFIVHFIVNVIGKVVVFLYPEGWGIHMFEYVISPFLAGQYGMKGFLYIAPRYSRPWTVVMAGFYCFAFGVLSFASAYIGEWSSVLWPLSAVAGVFYFLNSGEE